MIEKKTILSDFFFLKDGTIYKHNWKTGPETEAAH